MYCIYLLDEVDKMSGRGKMDQAAKSRIMSSEYKKTGGTATDWSKRAQSAADRNYSGGSSGTAGDEGGWCTIL